MELSNGLEKSQAKEDEGREKYVKNGKLVICICNLIEDAGSR